MKRRLPSTVFALFMAVMPVTARATGADFAATMIASHNRERAAMGLSPLAWDQSLASAAGQWARHLASTGEFEHAPEMPDAEPQGENLWMGTQNAYSYEAMVGGWIEEKRHYHHGRFPNVTTTADWSDVGHYTQLIWHSTTHVGCAVANGGGNDVLVCRYAPAGNWDGEVPTGSRSLASVDATSLANASAR